VVAPWPNRKQVVGNPVCTVPEVERILSLETPLVRRRRRRKKKEKKGFTQNYSRKNVLKREGLSREAPRK
jgi:hypothetical protein